MSLAKLLRMAGVRKGLPGLPARPPEAKISFSNDGQDEIGIYANRAGWEWLSQLFASAASHADDFVMTKVDQASIGGPLEHDSANVTLVDWDWSQTAKK